jgi:hypothetical protein
MSDLPIVCTLSPEALEARRAGLLSELLRQSIEHQRLPDGVRLAFAASSGVLALLAAAVEAERQCCRFLRFAVRVEPDGGPITLDLTGPPGAREFLAALLDI